MYELWVYSWINSYKVEKWEKTVNISVDIQYMWRRVTVFNIQSSGGGFCQGTSVLNATCEGHF